MNYRIGFGIDFHQLVPDRKLMLGGIELPSEKGALGHSDGDVLLHAICDALLGALNLGDIGLHFPNTDPEYKDIDSKILLRKIYALVREKNYFIGNIDATICLEKPKISGYANKMRETIASMLDIASDQISIKATTTEKMGFVGREEGIVAYATLLLGTDDK
jgi:2-C-methyl-D-erythritol 2,4-cyclodiphosphate synthase